MQDTYFPLTTPCPPPTTTLFPSAETASKSPTTELLSILKDLERMQIIDINWTRGRSRERRIFGLNLLEHKGIKEKNVHRQKKDNRDYE